jgi:hypothetical protein
LCPRSRRAWPPPSLASTCSSCRAGSRWAREALVEAFVAFLSATYATKDACRDAVKARQARDTLRAARAEVVQEAKREMAIP